MRAGDTLIMERPMVDELAGYLKQKCRSFLPFKDKCKKPDDQRRFAKYLGKYA